MKWTGPIRTMRFIRFGCTGKKEEPVKTKSLIACALWIVMLSCMAMAQQGNLETVLASMDKASASFKVIECSFNWDQFTKVVNDTDTQAGHMFFRRSGESVEMA